jgi:PAS domain S-box-containing protein
MNEGMYHYRYLPDFCRFLLEERLDDFCLEQLRISRQLDLPILRRLQHFSDEQLLEISRGSMTEYLTYLSGNKAAELIKVVLDRWLKDQLEVIGKFELEAADITLITHIRNKSFRNFVLHYTSDVQQALHIIDELDQFFTMSITTYMDTYIILLKEELERHEKDLLEAQRIAHIGSFEWDLQGDRSTHSPELRRIFELGEGASGLAAFMEYVHPHDREILKNSISQALQEGIFECEYRYLKDGKTKYIWSKGKAVVEDGSTRLLGTVQDITERKLTEQRIIEKTQALERSNESLQQFAYVASHDLKEPLRKIATFTDMALMQEKELSAITRRNLEKVHLSASRMRQMIDGIMAYSTLTHWEGQVDYPLDELVKEATEILEQGIEEKNAVIHYGGLPEVRVVPSQFRQLFQNFIANSLKFSRPGVPPEITITHQWLVAGDPRTQSLIPAHRYLLVSVKDNGIGFNVEFVNKVFDLYSRLHNRADYEGSGLGLAIAKRIIDNHGGHITATAEEGKGACFSFIIPQ